jgi:PhnB protein
MLDRHGIAGPYDRDRPPPAASQAQHHPIPVAKSPRRQGDTMQVQPYLFFDGRCDEALELYRKTLGAEVLMLMRFKDSPCAPPPGVTPPADKVMHACVRIGDTSVMASDGQCMGKASFQGFSLSLTVPDEAEADRLFAALGEGGQVQMPLTKTFFSPRFGMVADRFGVSWMILVAQQAQAAVAA